MAMIETHSQQFQKAYKTANATDSAYPTRIPTATEPTNDGVIDLAGSHSLNVQGAYVQNAIFIVPYATASNNDTFAMKVVGWRLIEVKGVANTQLWIPTPLGEFNCIASTAVGVADMIIVATERFADTMTIVHGDANDPGVTMHVYSPADNTLAHVTVDLEGCQKVEILFQITSGPTDMNALCALL